MNYQVLIARVLLAAVTWPQDKAWQLAAHITGWRHRRRVK